MSEIPHIEKDRHQGSFPNWCVHYNGLGKSDTCDAGVKYEDVKEEVEHTYSYGPKTNHPYRSSRAHPCFKDEAHLTKGCDKCRFPTQEEIDDHNKELYLHVNKVGMAREAIIAHLAGKFGSGKIPCPVCKTGTLMFTRASINGHVHANCTTGACVRWME